MSQTIHLGTVLGGRYKVTARVVTTAEQDQVLEARDQLLERKVSVLAAGPHHTEQLISNAREVATGGMGGTVQVLDLGQANGVTYLVAAHTTAEHLLNLLLTDNTTLSQESEQQHALGAEIFGSSSPEPHSDYEAVDPDATEVYRSPRHSEEPEQKKPAVVAWTQADYDAYGMDSPVSRSPEAQQDGTLFDRAASDSVQQIHSPSRESHHTFSEYGEESDSDDDDYHFVEDGEGGAYDEDPEDDSFREGRPAGRRRRRGASGSRRPAGAGLWVTFLLVLVLLLALIGFGFTRLGTMVTSLGQSAGANPSASPSSASATLRTAPKISQVTRLVPDQKDFMSDQDSTLTRLTDGDSSTVWTSYGFSTPDFGQVVSGFGLAAKLKEPTQVRHVTLQETGATGGAFTVYVNDHASLDGATKAGTGTFSSGKTTVDLNDAAKKKDAQYVIVYLTQLPEVQQSISGYNYGIRLGEISLS